MFSANARRGLIPLLAVTSALVGGCSDITFGGYDEFEGHYNYAGTVDHEPGDVVAGTITITQQRGSRARVVIDWSYYDQGVEILRITTERAADAHLGSRGHISFEFTGEIFLDGRRSTFRLSHDGWLDHRAIDGDWTLVTGLPTTDFGAFVAHRQ